MALTPVTANSDSTKVILTYTSDATSLANIDTQFFYKEVIHKIQTEESCLRPYVTQRPQKGVFDVVTLTDKRDPARRTQAIPDSTSSRQTFETRAIRITPFDDGAWLIDSVVKNATISVPRATVESMMKGYERLFDRIALGAMLQPVRRLKSDGSDDWKEGKRDADEISLENTRIGGKVSTSALLNPSFETFQKIRRKFYDNNVNRMATFYGLLTPRMEEILQGLTEYKNRDYIYSLMTDKNVKVIPWFGINWVKASPEIAPGAFYASKYIANQSASDLADAQDTATNGFDLSSTNHEVIPIWVKENVIVGSDASLNKMDILKRPDKRNTNQLLMTKYYGGTRLQNNFQYNLVIPT